MKRSLEHPGRTSAALACAGVALLTFFAPSARAETPPGATRVVSDADRRCLQCHGQAHIAEMTPAERLAMVGTWLGADAPPPGSAPPTGTPGPDEPATRPGLFINTDVFVEGPHTDVSCVSCHADAERLPHTPKLAPVSCGATCHADESHSYAGGSHAAALARGDELAPTCVTCHGGHTVLRTDDRRAPQNMLNSLHLCGDCHAKHRPTPESRNPAKRIANYLDSAHARAITKAGLPTAATCSNCHGAHGVKPGSDPESPVNRANIAKTCGTCHIGVIEVYEQSVHGRVNSADHDTKAAVCTDCHKAHRISLASAPTFMSDVVSECGQCHDSPDANGDRVGSYYRTYARSYHGQVTRLGGTRAARCSDCHGAHDIKPVDDPASRVAKANLVQTCSACHPNASAAFVRFDPHANHHDGTKYPVLHGVWWYFMIVMSSVFTFFGIHTILWFIRSVRERRKHPGHAAHPKSATAIRRFTPMDRVNHLFVVVTFLGLTATGIPLVFSGDNWAGSLAAIMGGVEAAGLWHRFFAFLLIANLIVHGVNLVRRFVRRKIGWREWAFGPESMAPRWKDVRDVTGMFRWFIGRGPRPRFDRWTYWEKFDYWAEIGGSVILIVTGALLWFPELASRFVPGWTFNVAMIIHGYEALLAIGFIFTIHFFNTHLRPGAFPVDEVIFTGSVPEEELKENRPEEYDRLVKRGQLESLRVPAPDPKRRPAILAATIVAVGIGIVLLGLILAGGLT